MIADERGGALLVDKHGVGRAVARPRQDPEVAPAGPHEVAVGQAHVGAVGL